METTRFTAPGELIPRLIAQVGGNKEFAIKLMKKNGLFLNPNGTFYRYNSIKETT